MKSIIRNSSVMIIGGSGSLGRALVKRFLKQGNHVIVYSRDEAKHFTIKNEHVNDRNLSFIVGDVRDEVRLVSAIKKYSPEIVILAAALKQVETCEISPEESIKTNIVGTQTAIAAAQVCAYPAKFLFVSTDKACSPVTTYGMCKAVSERLVTSNNDFFGKLFLCTRYGNVLESRGSIVPLFKYQAENRSELTVTDPDMTRFLMTLDESVDLIEVALVNGRPGEIWIPKLPSMRIGDLAEIFSEISKKPMNVIGFRPGEKKHEDLVNVSEAIRTIEVEDHYVISHAMSKNCGEKEFTYSSNMNVMSKSELFVRLKSLGIIDAPLESFVGGKIEEIRTT